MEHCVIEYGGGSGGYNANLGIYYSPTIRNSTIRYSGTQGLWTSSSAAILENNTITDSATYGAYLGAGIGNAAVTFQGNTVESSGSYPLHLQMTSFPSVLTGNTYTNNAIQEIELVGGTASNDLTIPNEGLPYVVISTITYYRSSPVPTMTIEPGVTLKFTAGTALNIGYSGYSGILIAQGTPTEPITFTSNDPSPAPGQWKGILLADTTSASIMEHCVIEYGGGSGGYNANLGIYYSPTIRNSTIRYSERYGIYTGGGAPMIKQNNIINNSLAGLYNAASTAIVARLNWWGDVSGPSGDGPGSGSAVSGNLLFEPWLGAPVSAPFQWVDALESRDPFTQGGGVTTFSGILVEAGDWTTTLKDSTSTTVRTFTGTGNSFSQDWFGDDAGGSSLPNGTYTYQLDATSLSTGQAAAPAIGTVTLNDALSIVGISSPIYNQMLSNVIDIIGTASGAPFSSYKVEYGSGVFPTNWTQISYSTTPMTDGLLASWDTLGLTGSIYTLRLSATSTTGEIASDLVTIRVLSLFNLVDTPDPFSPNGDGVKDTSTISVQSTFHVDWTLTIKDASNAIVKTLSGSGQLISQVWDGSDTMGVTVPDGIYPYQFEGTHVQTGITATSATGQLTVDLTPPAAEITSPGPGDLIYDDMDYVEIIGTASDSSASSYQLSFGEGENPTSWTIFGTDSGPVSNGLLGRWQTRSRIDGAYVLRLVATDAADNKSMVEVGVTIDNIISNVSASPVAIDPVAGEVSTIYYALSRPVDITIRMYDSPTHSLVRTLMQDVPSSPGSFSEPWDGRDDLGELVAPEAYYFTISVQDSQGRKRDFNNATTPWIGPVPSVSGIASGVADFDPYRNDVVTIELDTTEPGRLSLKVNPALMRTLLDKTPLAPGHHTLYWDGRRDDGTFYEGPFSFWSAVPEPLELNPIIVQPGSMKVEQLLTEPYIIQPVFGEITTITYTLAVPADVTINIQDPNGNHFRTLIDRENQSAGAQSVEWLGDNDAGMAPSIEGDYAVRVQATDPTTGLSVERTGVVLVYR